MALLLLSCFAMASIPSSPAQAQAALPAPVEIASGWQLQDAAKVPESIATLSAPGFAATGWHAAVVPGTVLTTLVNDGIYPEPLYGENNRPDSIPESLAHTCYWYRTTFAVPQLLRRPPHLAQLRRHQLRRRGLGQRHSRSAPSAAPSPAASSTSPPTSSPAAQPSIAVLVSPQPHPGVPHEHTLADGMGKNGGITAIDGPTFLSTIGWDWIPAIRDRDTGIWQKVFLSATGPVVDQGSARHHRPAAAAHSTPPTSPSRPPSRTSPTSPQHGVLKGSFGDVSFSQGRSTLAPQQLAADLASIPQPRPALHVDQSEALVAQRLRPAEPLHAASHLRGRQATSPTARTSPSASARSPTPFPTPRTSPSPSTASASSSAAATGASTKP